MIIRHSDQIVLDPETRDTLRTFLSSAAGDRVLQALSASCPEFVDKGSAEDRLAAAYSHNGYEKAIETLIFLTQQDIKSPEAPPAYPSLDDDEKWKAEHTEQVTQD